MIAFLDFVGTDRGTIAERIPTARKGTVEILPIVELSGLPSLPKKGV
jgi:hypothetical protein